MPLRIAFDLDGVLADMESELVRQAGILFGDAAGGRPSEPADDAAAAAVPPATVDAAAESPEAPQADALPSLPRLNLTARQQRKLWAHVESIDNFWTTLEELEPGIVARLASVASERRWEIIFLTKRPESAGVTAQVQTQRWLEAKGFSLPSVFVVQSSRGRIADALAIDVVVDDRPENCLDVVTDSKARAILIWRDDDGQLPAAARRLGVGVVRSVAECLDILVEADRQSRAEPGVLNRMMRLLGLKEAART